MEGGFDFSLVPTERAHKEVQKTCENNAKKLQETLNNAKKLPETLVSTKERQKATRSLK